VNVPMAPSCRRLPTSARSPLFDTRWYAYPCCSNGLFSASACALCRSPRESRPARSMTVGAASLYGSNADVRPGPVRCEVEAAPTFPARRPASIRWPAPAAPSVGVGNAPPTEYDNHRLGIASQATSSWVSPPEATGPNTAGSDAILHVRAATSAVLPAADGSAGGGHRASAARHQPLLDLSHLG